VREELLRPGCVLFEGAQGILLDEWRGFHPHTTWSSTGTVAVEAAIARFEIGAPVEHYGVLRSYLTRHGVGPLPTHDEALDESLPEPHNHAAGWQGHFRRGHPDAVLLRYALDAVGNLNGLLVSHLDVFQRGLSLKWCEGYFDADSLDVARLPVGAGEDLSHQATLTDLLMRARPRYTSGSIRSDAEFLARIRDVTSLPVLLRSYGATADDVREH